MHDDHDVGPDPVVAVYDQDLLFNGHDGIFVRDGEPFTGTGRRLANNGAVIAEDRYENGIQEGRSRYWYSSGEPRGEAHFRHDSLHGPTKEWFQDGRLRRDAMFEHGILVSDKTWDETGKQTRDFEIKETDRSFRSLQKSRKIHGDE
jgi:antitoxin component YwqK of YwqJK toxin-antitoxin module